MISTQVENVFPRRGCQAPWQYFDDSPIPKCRNLTAMETWFNPGTPESTQNFDRTFFSALHSANVTGCPLPCTTTTYT